MHDDPLGHYHGDDPNAILIMPSPDWLNLISVGIDIGSSTSHLTFSKLVLHRQGMRMTSRFEVVERQVLYRSPIMLTPYVDIETIDLDALTKFVNKCYVEAGINPQDINTGAVISTGEAVRKKNAEAIVRLFSSEGGRFVCATAGPHLEGVLAAHGSGAVEASKQLKGRTVMNVDMGGGTSKITIIQDGEVIETGAINVGARLVAWDTDGKLERIEAAGRRFAQTAGFDIENGQVLTEDQRSALAKAQADVLFEFINRGELSPLATELMVTNALTYKGKVDRLVFSGGVSEYVYHRESTEYGDLGPLLGQEVRDRLPALGIPLREATEYIRATVVGASQYTIQLSSSTIYVSQPDILPIFDRQVVVPHLEGEEHTAASVAQAIHGALARADLLDIEIPRPIALFFRWPGAVSYNSLHALAEGIAQGMSTRADDPVVLVFDTDIGGIVGAILKEELKLKAEVVATDEIQVGDLDFIDIGQTIGNRQAVPVVVKSLIFG
jgi:ethanolamine utilization protein EutA